MKIIIIGCPGSGKSYLAKRLGQILNLKVYHLDVLYWGEGWIPKKDFKENLRKIYLEDDFIIDGNYESTLEERFEMANRIYFLDISTEICIESEKKRRGAKRDDLPDYLIEEYDPSFIEYIKSFNDNCRIKIIKLIEKYKNEKEIIVFTNRTEEENYLIKLFN